MNWKRFAKKNLIPFYSSVYNIKDLVTKVQDNGLPEGIKKKLKEDFIEDMPIIGNVYDLGMKHGEDKGVKKGYARASNEYEKKLLRQADEFLNQKNDLKMTIEDLNKLLDEYEKRIQELQSKCESLTREQLIFLNKLINMQKKLSIHKSLKCLDDRDTNKIESVIEAQLSKLAIEYLLTEEEENDICEILNNKLNNSTLKDILVSSNCQEYVYKLIKHAIETVVEKRENINTYKDEDLTKSSMKENDVCCNKNSPSDLCNHENKESSSMGIKYVASTLLEYDERGFIKNTARHKNGTRYDDEGYDKYGYDKYGNKKCTLVNADETVSDSSEYDERGFIKNTARHKNGTKYDDEGYDKYGYDRNGNKKCSLDNGNETIENSSIYDEKGFIKNTAKHRNGTKYDDEGYDKYGYDKNGNKKCSSTTH